jgi:oligosaccharide repeat unit polymerase
VLPFELIVPATALAVVAVLARTLQGSWLAPGPLFALTWSTVVWVSLVSPIWGTPVYPVWQGALWWIVAATGVLCAGSLAGDMTFRRAARNVPLTTTRFAPTLPGVRFLIPAGVAIGLLYAAISLGLESDPPTYLQIILVPNYAGPVLGGMLFATDRSRRRHLAWLTLVPGFFIGLMGVGRTAVIAPMTFWLAGYFGMSVYVGGSRLKLFRPRHILAGMLLVPFVLFIGVSFQVFRLVILPYSAYSARLAAYWNLLDSELLSYSWEWMQSSIFGHVAAFSAYFETAWHVPPRPSMGQQTLNGFFRLLNVPTPDVGDSVEIDGINTNVFTIFKPPIADYTLAGALLLFFLIGVTSGLAYRRVREGRLWPIAILATLYANTMLLGGWFFTYNSISATYFAVGFYLRYVERRQIPAASTDYASRAGALRSSYGRGAAKRLRSA